MSNNANETKTVKFPQKEVAVAFIPENGQPFQNALIGTTYPNAEYRIDRSRNSQITVFEYVLEGQGEILFDGKWKPVTAGQIYILRSGEEHHYRSDRTSPYKKIWINYVSDYLPVLLDAYGISSGIYSSENAKDYFAQLIELSKSMSVSQNTYYMIADCVHKIAQEIATDRLSEKSDEYMIRDALNASVYKKLNLDDIATKLHVSKSNIIRVFKKNYGVTPYEYLLGLKISTAKLLLKDTKMTIKEIADRLYISDEHYFSTLFLSRVGMRPKDYRTADAKGEIKDKREKRKE